jgi:putative phosphoribosyl transferase
MRTIDISHKAVRLTSGEVELEGDLEIPDRASGIVVFAHGSGSSRHSPRNKYVASVMQERNLGTLLFDLLTREEEAIDVRTRHLRFDVAMLAKRLVDAVAWVAREEQTRILRVGLFGSSTGAAAALVAAAEIGDRVGAIVSRGGRPDLAGDALQRVRCPVLMIVGGWDGPVIELNRIAYSKLTCDKELHIVPAATHLFEEPGKLEIVADLAATFFQEHLS